MGLVSLADIRGVAKALGYPTSKAHLIKRLAREGARRVIGTVGRGQAGFLFILDSLSSALQCALGKAEGVIDTPTLALSTTHRPGLPSLRKAAESRVKMMHAVRGLLEGGASKLAAFAEVAGAHDASVSTVKRLWKAVEGLHHTEWFAALTPAYKARKADPVPKAVLDYFYADYGRPEKPQLQATWERTVAAAKKNGWGEVPSAKTLKRRWDELPFDVRTLWREGERKLDESFPHQERDRSGMMPLDGVNVDDRIWDVWVSLDTNGAGRWNATPVNADAPLSGGGKAVRLHITVVQDEATNLLLSHAIDLSENKDQYRRALCDTFIRHGLPKKVRFDNTRAAANKDLTGGAKTRFRFKAKPEDIDGLLVRLGIEVSFTKPYNGRAKLVERLFADLKERSEKHIALAGAYTGRSPTEKPANYGEASVDLDTFKAVFAQAVEHYNTRTDRRGKVAHRTSYKAVFDAGLAQIPVRRLTEAQRRFFFLEAMVRKVSPSGTVSIGKGPHINRFGSPALKEFVGRDVIVRYDPNSLTAPVFAETMDHRPIADAVPCLVARGFNDTASAREYERAKRAAKRKTRELAAEIGRLDLAAAQAANPPAPPTEEPLVSPKVVEPRFAKKPPNPAADSGIDTDKIEKALRRNEDIQGWRTAG